MSVDRVSLLASIATDVLNVDGVSPNNHGSQAAHVVDTAADQAMAIGVDEEYPADLKPASNMYAAQAAAEALSVEGVSPLAMELASSTNSAQFVVVQALAARIVAAAHSTVTDHGTTMQPTRYTNSTEVPIVDWVSPIVPGML